MSMIPVFAKLPAATPDVVELARGIVRAGAHGLTLMDSPQAMGIESETLRPTLGPVTGWLSGPGAEAADDARRVRGIARDARRPHPRRRGVRSGSMRSAAARRRVGGAGGTAT
jgi:dihydroorotate dehydrogenase (NAD+) catalytic subunit